MQRSHNNRANLERRIGTPFQSRRHDGMQHGAGVTTDVAGSLVDWPFNNNPASSPSSQQQRLYSPLQSTMASGFSSTCSVHTDQLAVPKSRDELWEAAAVSYYYCSYYCHEQEAERENRGVLHVQESLLHAIHARVRNSVYTFRYTPGAMVQGMYVYVCGGLDVAPNLRFCA